MASIELIPGKKSEFPIGGWHVSCSSWVFLFGFSTTPLNSHIGFTANISYCHGIKSDTRSQVEGQMNERICATALYYLDSENITTNDLSFRMQTSAYMNDEYSVGQDAYHWMEQIYGTGLGSGSAPCLQNYGSVETKEGRVLAFPNVL